MTEAASPAPQPLEIRGKPRPVKRFSKRALMVLIGTGSAIVLGSLAFALQGPKDDTSGPARELYNTGHNPEADGLAALPKSYGELPPEEDILGPPLPGDLGTPILKAQREGRMGLPAEDVPEMDPMREQLVALEAELRAREAALTDAARGSGVFFQVGSGAGPKNAIGSVASPVPGSLSFPDLSGFAPSREGAFGSSLTFGAHRHDRATARKRWVKRLFYDPLPLGARALAYAFYRYVIRLGFLDGAEGTAFHALQGFWYRYLVDAKLLEIRRAIQQDGLSPMEAVQRYLDVKGRGPILPASKTSPGRDGIEI